jgi:competence protein ComEA
VASEPPELVDPTSRSVERPPPPRSWRDRVEQVADATGTTPGRLVAGAVVALFGVVGALWLMRPPPAPVEASLPFTSSTAATATSETSTTIADKLVVDVAGAVVVAGVHELPPGSRVVDAIAAAGGLAPSADGARINLAAPLADGERVYVPAVGEDPPPVVVGSSPSSGTDAIASGPLDLNAADESALETLPGIGPATAAAIIQHRAEIGRFTAVDQLLDVPGIGDAKLASLRDLVTV